MRKFWRSEWEQIRKHGLYWLLLLSCVGVTLVMAHQARTVEQQRLLIRVLQSDSQELFASRIHDLTSGKKAPAEQKPAVPEPEPEVKTPPPAAQPPVETAPMLHPARAMRSI